MARPRPARGRSLPRRAGRILGGLAALAGIVLAGAAGAVWWTLPGQTGEVRLPGLSAPVGLAFDDRGIPTLRAASEADAHRALGWLHARDRLFQMELMRRGASGRLAEVAGAPALRLDRFTRTLGLARRAEADLAALPPDTRAALEAYAAGVNARIADRGRWAAPEFLALGAPEPWTPRDSLLWGKAMGLYLSGNWRLDLDRARLARLLPPERLRELWPEDPGAGRPDLPPPDLAHLPEPGRLARLAARLPAFPGDAPLPASASNAWAVAGARTARGAPLLASDPHLGFSAPVLWYLVRIETPGGVLAGASAPGVPFLPIGRNRDLAWGFTTTHSDVQDVFVERLEGADSYATPEGPRPFLARDERIAVRGAPDAVLRVRETRHGPVVSDLDADDATPSGPSSGTVLAVAMANLAPGDTAAAGLHALNRARSVDGARAAAALITSPPQNLMVADAAGGIAMLLTGRTPVRRGGDGTLPAPGWDGAADWTGWVPFDALPYAGRPASGVLVNANNRVAPPDHPVFLGRDWFGDWRFARIHALLAGHPRADAAGMAALQADPVSLLAREVLPVLRALPRPGDAAAAAAWDRLRTWDGTVAADSAAAHDYHAWMRRLGVLALAAGGVPAGAWEAGPEFLRFVLAPDGRGAHWCGAEGCPALAARALADSAAGADAPAGRAWGAVHAARFEHPLLRFVPGLGALTRLSAPTPGDGQTVSRGGFPGRGEAPFAHVHGAGLRLVADLADGDSLLAVIGTGQSGHPLSRHWGDQLALWAAGGTAPVAAAGPATLRLVP